MKLLLTSLVLFVATVSLFSQNYFAQDNSIPVYNGSKTLKYPWAGGLNNPQFGNIDLDGDGTDDLVVFNRGYYDGGQTILTFISGGTLNAVDYTYAPEYVKDLPDLRHFMLAVDFNCDGVGDFVTWKNPAVMMLYLGERQSNGRLSFIKKNYFTFTTETGNSTNIFISAVDVPAMIDVNNDGDIDVLTFSPAGLRVEYYENLSVENGLNCGDTIGFDIRSYCWGDVKEDGLSRRVSLYEPCGTPKDDEIVAGGARHAGSTLMAFDENADGLKELVLGDISFDNLVNLHNNGLIDSAVVTSQDTLFPSYNRSLQMPIFPAAFYVDVDNDGNRDMLVGPNTPKKGANYNCSWFYKDVSTNNNVNFEFQTDTFLVDDMIDLGEGAYPAFVDVNGDDLVDLVVGNNGYYENTTSAIPGLALFINVGTPTAPAFRLVDRDYLGLSAFLSGVAKLQTVVPAFGDMNGDGALDLIIGDHVGYIHYFRNTAAAGDSMKLVLDQPQFKNIDVGSYAKPEIFDVNGDGLPDLIIGRDRGNLQYFENIGTTSNPNFSLVPTNSNFGEVNVKPNLFYGESTPRVANLTYGGQPYLLVGNVLGNIAVYELDATKRYSGAFTRVDSVYSGIDIGEYAHLSIADIDGDGLLEMVVGSLRGGLNFFFDTGSVGVAEVEQQQNLAIKVYPNPAAGNWQIEMGNIIPGVAINVSVYDVLGKEIYQSISVPTSTSNVLPLNIDVVSGVYICRVQQGKYSTVHRLLAQ
jgi:hypothetical protein